MQVSDLSGVTALSLGQSDTCALKSDSTVWVPGWNYYGNLGNGTQGISEEFEWCPCRSWTRPAWPV